MLSYIYLLQSSIGKCACKWPIAEDQVVYRGLSSGGSELGLLYASLIGQIVVWKDFTSTSSDIECAMRDFVQGSDGILFGITLRTGAVATAIRRYSAIPNQHEILIAAISGFIIDSVDYIRAPQLGQGGTTRCSADSTIPKVKLRYWLSWIDFDIDDRPTHFIV
jgi:hypothetical protein